MQQSYLELSTMSIPQVVRPQLQQTHSMIQPQQHMIPQVTQMQTRQSTYIGCQHCQSQVQTNVEYKVGKGQWLFAIMLLPKTLFCCVVPFMIRDCKDAIHKCPNCQQIIGRKNFIFE